ncbi:hypothetical protein ACWT_6674 [Actinoplanes sp. SE50]|nr:yehI-like uncharacterized protein [Actinoplanes sp. SE50/110]ATO86089.1 hypothetical protein ACWT_6674 [Actinoplanes sp. SE50]SLM03503.1 hypothetical protein ACSP50_6793 [Actinoplanes sp. SE50/110]
MIPAMDKWLELIPAAVDAEPAPDSRRWAFALQWHLAAAERGSPDYGTGADLYELTAEPLPWRREDLSWALRVLGTARVPYDGQAYRLPAVIANQLPVDQLRAYGPVLGAVLDEVLSDWTMPTEARRSISAQYGTAIGRLTGGLPAHLLFGEDGFGPLARHRLGARVTDPATRDALAFAITLTKPVPAKSWLRQAERVRAAGPEVPASIGTVLAAFVELGRPVHDDHDLLLRGLSWLLSLDPGEESTTLLGRVAATAATPWRQGGARLTAAMTAAATVEILTDRPGQAPAGVLGRLMNTRSRPLRDRVWTALERIAAARGWAPGEAMELAVADHDLAPDSTHRYAAGDDFTLGVEIIGEKATVRAWQDGLPLRGVPAALRLQAGPARTLAAEVNKTLAAERARVEALLAQDRTWDWPAWEQRYLRHPVTGTLGRRLIWEVSTAGGTSWTAALPEPDGAGGWRLAGHSGAGCSVRLWHPVLADPAEVTAWRDRITTAELRQPFKQAFREVYRLTPAETQTGTYSNRFAGHILRYRQANALMRVRGWSATYLGTWSSGADSAATKEFAAGEWEASFAHESAGPLGHRDEVEFCSTDQVRFARREGHRWEPARVDEVPPRVLSEALRDVDLFIGVTSIATDDSWTDRGEHPFRAYWREIGFGTLSGSAEVRRDVLARLLPRLTIAARCDIDDRFLRVHGTRTTYKIHLGSANILMEPNDAYLCIVPTGRHPRLALPFDDDERLSVILSKAFLLAADDRITDPSILHQLPR